MRAPDEEARRRQERKERFLREANQPPPPVPVKRIAHPGGKIVTSDKDAALLKLIARKQKAGEPLSEDQHRALATLTTSGAVSLEDPPPSQEMSIPSANVRLASSATKVVPAAKEEALMPAGSSSSKRARTLRKKLHEIAELERRVAEGGILQENQKAKLAAKPGLIAEMASIDGSFAPEGPSGCTAESGKKG